MAQSVYRIGSQIIRSGAGAGPWRQVSAFVPDFYISPSGSDSNDGLSTSSPWAITALNTKRASYSPSGIGKIIEMADGTYDISSLMTTSRDAPAVDIEGGTSGHPVVIRARNPRMAVITAGGATPYNVVNAMIGHTPARRQGYITLNGLYVTGGRTNIIELGTYAQSSNVPGIRIVNCEITGNSDLSSNPGGGNTPGSGGGNAAGVTFNGCLSPEVGNCYIHDNEGHATGSADHLSGVLVWLSRGYWVHNCTIVKSGYAVYGKETVNQGALIESNYFDINGQTDDQGQVYDHVGAPTAGLTDTTVIRNNVIVSYAGANLRDNLDAGGWSTPLEVYNNTIIGPITNAGFSAFAQAGNNRFLKYYNNIHHNNGSNAVGYGWMCLSLSAAGLIDYNIHGNANFTTVPDGNYTTISTTNYTSITNWRTAMAGSTGAEAHSIIGTATFTNVGTFAKQYTTTTGAAFQAGRVGGTSGGAVCDIGADAANAGCDFV